MPASVWDASNSHYNDDILSRPLYANWADANGNNANILVNIHNNGSGGTGTETLYDTTNGHQVESKRLADILHAKIVGAIRGGYNPNWVNRLVQGFNGNYGEIREATRPAVIVEIAFMDRQFPDNAALQDEQFKSLVAQAISQGVAEYFGGGALPPPTLVSPGTTTAPGSSVATLTPTFQWQPVTGADGYGLFVSKFNGSTYDLVFNSETDVGNPLTGTSYVLPAGKLQDNGQYRWNMSAHNSAGYGTPNASRYYFNVNLIDPPLNDNFANAATLSLEIAHFSREKCRGIGKIVIQRRVDQIHIKIVTAGIGRPVPRAAMRAHVPPVLAVILQLASGQNTSRCPRGVDNPRPSPS